MISKIYSFTTSDEKNVILTFLFALYGNYYATGAGRVHTDRKSKTITLILKD